MRRLLFVLAALLVGATTARAKIPPFEVEVSPESPVAGEPFQVAVHLEQEVPVEAFDSLIALYPVGDPSQIRNLVVSRTDDTTYHAEVTIDEPGEWVIIAFPNRTGWSVDQVPEGYPDRIPIKVRSSWPQMLATSWVAAAVGLGLLLAGFRLRSSSPVRTR